MGKVQFSDKIPQNIKDVLDRITQKLVMDYRPERIYLFGSYAEGIFHQDSDIDLLIIKETSKRWIDRWTTVRMILSEVQRGIPMDTFVLTPNELGRRLAMGDSFISDIVENGIELYVE